MIKMRSKKSIYELERLCGNFGSFSRCFISVLLACKDVSNSKKFISFVFYKQKRVFDCFQDRKLFPDEQLVVQQDLLDGTSRQGSYGYL